VKIGTMSLEIVGRNDKWMVLSSADRRDIVAHVASKHSPELLVCAGFSLSDPSDLDALKKDPRILDGRTSLVASDTEDQMRAPHDPRHNIPTAYPQSD